MPGEPAMRESPQTGAKPVNVWLQRSLLGGGLALLGTVIAWVVIWKVIR
jgi:hypothetical protein